MSQRNRRQFMEESMAVAAAAVAGGSASDLFAAEQPLGGSPNERLGVAVVGVRGRGGSHIGAFAGRKDTEILYLCDVDREIGMRRVRETAKRQQGREPRFEEDLRKALDDPNVDIVSIATPHHWHALGAIWSMQAGKDVYLEKPVSHNLCEGRRIVEAARKYRRICQAGAQCRSSAAIIEAMEYLRRGELGQVRLARGLCRKRPHPIGPRALYLAPPAVNYDLWLGPAPAAPLTRPQLHYDWRWQWPYGCGELGEEAVHQLDLARWGLGKDRLSSRVISCGGRFGCDDAGETANSQIVIHDFGDAAIVFEVRASKIPPCRGAEMRLIFEAAEGFVVIAGYRKGAAFDPEGNKLREFSGGGGNGAHFDNFLKAVRSRRVQDLNADIEEGHLSGALCHLGNISYRLGESVPASEAWARLEDFGMADGFGTADLVRESLRRAARRFRTAGPDVQRSLVTAGLELVCDADSETIMASELANQLLDREYRQPFVIPAPGKV